MLAGMTRERSAAATAPPAVDGQPREIRPFERASADGDSGIQITEVAPAEPVDVLGALTELQLQPGVSAPQAEIELRRGIPARYTARPVELYRLEPGWLETQLAVAITPGGEYLRDTLRTRRQALAYGYRPHAPSGFELPQPESVAERGPAFLLGLPVGGNYFHWLFEAVSRWLLASPSLPEDMPLVTPKLDPMERLALQAAGVPDERLVELPDSALLRFSELFVIDRGVRQSVQIAPAAARALRDLGAKEPATRLRLFISRANARRRRIVNDAELASTLERHGFTTLRAEELTVPEQIDLFASAEVVLGMHGAGLTNSVFCPAGTTILELQPSGLDRARIMLFWHLAAACGHRYVQVVCPEASGQEEASPSDRDIVVNIPYLEGVLARRLPPLL
jgi:hypothetical protein